MASEPLLPTEIPAVLALLRRSHALREEDPERMLELARRAADLAEELDPQRLGSTEVADLQARAWAELGDAYRAADDFFAAEATLAHATVVAREGTGDPLLRALLLERKAALLADGHRCSEACSLFEAARRIYQELDDRHLVGRVLVGKGRAMATAGEPARALQLLREGLAKIDVDRDPLLALTAAHHVVRALADCRRFWEALALLHQHRAAYARYGGPLMLLERTCLEGEIQAGLGRARE
ncbi:MAG TPA: tetratricopeptide repeat protein [Thermoanaerobaculia bacterium]|nr:tetratricopeptide repeat protein [Thermoanaerobaculia bacterium]